MRNPANQVHNESADNCSFASLVVANNIIYNNLLDIVRSGKPKKLRMARSRYVNARLISDPDPNISEFDLAVLSCLHAVWQDKSNPSNTFTISGVCRMLGYSSRGGLSPTSQQAVAASITRLAGITLQISPEEDFEPHRDKFAAANDLLDLASASWDNLTGIHWGSPNPLIEISRSLSRIMRAGIPVTAVTYTLTREPLLHLYSRITGQFVTIDGRYMHPFGLDSDGELTEAPIPMTSTRIGIIFWCARQAERVRYAAEHPSKKKKNDVNNRYTGTLLFSTICDRAGLSKRETSKHKGRHTEFLDQLLSCWTVQGLIPAWRFRQGIFGRVDAVVFDFSGCTSVQEQQQSAAPTSAAEMVPTTYDAPKIDTTIGAIDTIIGALITIIGAISIAARSTQKRAQSHFRSILVELEELRMYLKYSIVRPPAEPGGAGGAKIGQ